MLVSYELSEMIAKSSSPITERAFINVCMLKAAEILCPEKNVEE